jgi:hypothetical protein
MAIKIEFDATSPRKKLTGAALLMLEDYLAGEKISVHFKREYLACFAVISGGKTDGALMPRAQFDRLFAVMNADEIDQAFNGILEALKNEAVPLVKEQRSSEPIKTAEASPAG